MTKTIMLVCSAGMSSSLLVAKMEEAAEAKNIDVEIFATGTGDIDKYIDERHIDAVLLGPQVRDSLKKITNLLKPQNIPVESIDMVDYGRMNGKKVLDVALAMCKE